MIPFEPVRIIVCADDFGLTREVNEAVEIAATDGILTVASLMVGEAATEDAVERAYRLPQLGVGLHIVLVDGTPLSPPASIPDLVGPDGRFSIDQAQQGVRFFFKRGVRDQLATEIRAQFEAFRATGLALDHVNCHKHMHLHPTVAALIIEIGRDYGMTAMRVPMEPPDRIGAAERTAKPVGFGIRAQNIWSSVLRKQARKAGLAVNDWMFGLVWSGMMTERRVAQLIPYLPDGVSEIYFHPATSRGPVLSQLMPEYRHVEEFEALTSFALRRQIEDLGIERITYRDVMPRTRKSR